MTAHRKLKAAPPRQVDLFRGEEYLARRLREHGHPITDGVTDSSTRKTRMRAAIVNAKLDCVIVGKSKASGKTITYAQCFESLYGEKLEPKLTKGT